MIASLTLRCPGSPIESLLADAGSAGRGTAPRSGEAAAEGGDNKNTLADRIRALQTTASRVASN